MNVLKAYCVGICLLLLTYRTDCLIQYEFYSAQQNCLCSCCVNLTVTELYMDNIYPITLSGFTLNMLLCETWCAAFLTKIYTVRILIRN